MSPKAYIRQLPHPRLHAGFLALSLLLGLSLMIFQPGTLFFPDEYRYFVPLNIWDSLTHGQWQRAGGLFQSMLDRPLYYALYLPPLLLQWLLNGLSYQSDPGSGWAMMLHHLWIPVFWQTLLLLLNSHLVYRIGARFFKSDKAGLTAQLFYLLWLPHLIYTVHLLPALAGETFLLACVGFFPSLPGKPDDDNVARLEKAGLCWLMMLLAYPGYYYTGLGFAAALLLRPTDWKTRLHMLGQFFLPTILFAAGIELLLEVVFGVSYLDSLMTLARSVNQGNFPGALTFVMDYYRSLSPLYLTFVWLSTVLPTLFIVVYWISARLGRHHFLPQPVLLLAALWVALHGWLILNASLLRNAVIYARLLPPLALIPILIWAGIASGQLLVSPRQARALLVILSLVLVWPLGRFFQVAYPAEAYGAIGLSTGFLHADRVPDGNFRVERLDKAVIAIGHTLKTRENPGKLVLSCRQIPPAPTRLAVLNAEFILPITGGNVTVDTGLHAGQMRFDAPHPYEFEPYRYEGLDRTARSILEKEDLRIQVIENPCPERMP